ncbi:MBOAT family O-acyltransferase [Flavobacteriaceae bacterium 3-367]|uniref:MBOAT family O-acyltransferase n=1 Tax=Eudoraea algarum TaxID=3417568 RepID=UPI0032782E3B
MLFNSIEFLIFLPLSFVLYWFLLNRNLKLQNLLLVVLSYLFYGWWDWRFLSLIFLSTFVDYLVGQKIHRAQDRERKRWLWVSIGFNIGLLGVFKYFDFFVVSLIDALAFAGYEVTQPWMLHVLLPVGISFYTFQTLSYSLDVSRKALAPTKDFIAFAAYVSFFPQLVAGPIERAASLLPQILQKRRFSYQQGAQGAKLILWGFLKKVAIADSLAPIVDDIFVNYHSYSSPTLFMGAFFFGFQIYADFSGYSDIAIGTAKLFGIELRSNFKFPYLSRSVAEFWRRWHISLSTWFRDYLYIPLGGSKLNSRTTIRNIFIIFLVSGFWHGANWTFIVWGGIHALLFVPLFLTGTNRNYLHGTVAEKSALPTFREFVQISITFTAVTLTWIFFRAESIAHALAYLKRLFALHPYQGYNHPLGYRMVDYFILLSLFMGYEFIIRKDERSPFKFKSRYLRFGLYALVLLAILLFYDDRIDRSFIYFQF